MRKILRYSVYTIFFMLFIIAMYLMPKIQFFIDLYYCAINFECLVIKGELNVQDYRRYLALDSGR